MPDVIHVANVADVPEGTMRRFSIPGRVPIFIANVGGTYHAADDTCTHAQASLAAGQLVLDSSGIGCVECPRHGSRFDLATGAVKSLPAVKPLKTYPVTVQGDSLSITVQ